MVCATNGGSAGGPGTISKYLILTVNGCVYAIKITFVQKIVQISRILPLPHMAPHILGATQADGKVYTVVDLRILLGEGLAAAPLPSVAILLIYQGVKICVVADQVLSIIDIDTDKIFCPIGSTAHITGSTQIDTMYINFLNMGSLLRVDK